MDEPTQELTQDREKAMPEGSFVGEEEQSSLAVLVGSLGMQCRWALPKDGKRLWKFGRSAESDFQLDPARRRLSNQHFEIWATEDEPPTLMIRDVSTNGTFINNVRMTKKRNYMLVNGDVIGVGIGVPVDEVKFIVSIATANRNVAINGIHAQYEFAETIGQGAFALVRVAINRETGKKFAVKIINKSKITGGIAVHREIEILKALQNPYIVCLHDFFEDEAHYYLIMDYVAHGDLMDYVSENGAIPEDASAEIIRQVLTAVHHVHRMGISHRDLKPDNILIAQTDPIVVKVADFGLAKISSQGTFLKTFCGTLSYLAPEVLASRNGAGAAKYSRLVDIWSIGCLAYVILTGYLPFSGNTQEELYRSVMSGQFNMEPLKQLNVSKEALDFLSLMLTVDPNHRPDAYKALQHPWVTTIGARYDPIPVSSVCEIDGMSSLHLQSSQHVSELKAEQEARQQESKRQDATNGVPSLEEAGNHSESDHGDSDSDDQQSRIKADIMASQGHMSFGVRDLNFDGLDEADKPQGAWIKLATLPESLPCKDVFASSDSLTLGRVRSSINDVVIPDNRLSAVHWRIERKLHDGKYTIWLNNYSAKSFINGVEVHRNVRTQLHDGALLVAFVDTDGSHLGFRVHFLDKENYDYKRTPERKDYPIPENEIPRITAAAVPPTTAKRAFSGMGLKQLSVRRKVA
ncbi:Serine/threonine-protein kinase RAD53 [Wickerhamiella sorbophila]|uniref:Serine/threonine-protein kinase RAD53 n=1 Tax=Wickerhamiella sorbophila TaxID=45607 RepID=A0A2T0FLX9_9ASCO|nr:Serine/threonine-protein kinase RAD53 [Wickerhamiella sorbophila]PRT55994.1 Serine/threonine-protein kinase RAD53 [Wickerhamiella sorbophila]